MIREKGRTPKAQRIFATAAGYLSSANLARAMRMGVFRLLAERPLSAAELGERTGTPALDTMDLLDTLVALGLLERAGTAYANTAESAHYLDPHSPAYAGGMLSAVRLAA